MLLISNQITSTFKNNHNENIFYRNWKIIGQPKGIFLIVHGLNSHSAYYEKFATQLNENNFEVYAMDLPGRGQSEGERYYISDYKEILASIDHLLNIAKSEYPTIPVFLFGHSAGAVFASAHALHYQYKLKGLISESIAFQLPAPGFALTIIKFLGNIMPHKQLVKLNNEDFSRNISIVHTMNTDPLLANEKQPAKTMQQLLLAGEYLKKNMHEIKLPLLILHGTADKATKPSGSKYFMAHASSNDKKLNVYEGYYHDLLNDKFNGTVVADIINWLKERV